MSNYGLWQIQNDTPISLASASVHLEKKLEDWIERDPSLLQAGLTIVGRQTHTEAGLIDLLALDTQGRWVVIELKAGAVERGAVAQGIDYAAAISVMSSESLWEKCEKYFVGNGQEWKDIAEQFGISRGDDDRAEREVEIIIAGIGRASSLERMVDFLGSRHSVPISIISFEIFNLDSGEMIMLRELTEGDGEVKKIIEGWSMDPIFSKADETGIGKQFKEIYEKAISLGLYARPYKKSIMYTPPSMRTRMLFTVWAETWPDGSIMIAINPDAFTEFYPVSRERAVEVIGEVRERVSIQLEELPDFLSGLEELLAPEER